MPELPSSAGEAADPTGGLAHILPALHALAVPVDSLIPDPENPRGHDAKNLDAIRASLIEFGQLKPIVTRGNVIAAGNGTWQTFKALGWPLIARVDAATLTEAQARAYGIADNRTAELAHWKVDVLDGLMGGLPEELKPATGFSGADLDALVAGSAAGELGYPIRPVELRPPPTMVWILLGIPFDRFGDVQANLAGLEAASDVVVRSNRDDEHKKN